jgi:hypothetical protein
VEVSDSIHLRRFCRIALSERVPCESTVRKLTRRIGADTVNALTRVLISEAVREKRFRGRAVRIDSTVIEADVKYPTDAGLASSGVRALARESRKLAKLVKEKTLRVRDRSRSMGRTLRAITRTIRRRTGEAKTEVLKLTAKTGELLDESIRETRRLAMVARRRARGRGAKAKLKAASQLEELAERCEKISRQIKQRVAGEPIPDRLVSLSDPDARPIRKGKLGKPNEFGYVAQIAEVTENTKRGARGLILPAATATREPRREHAAPDDRRRVAERWPGPQGDRLGRRFSHQPHDRGAHPAHAGPGFHHRPPTTWVAAHAAALAALPNGRGRPHQPSEARLRTEPQPPQGPPGAADHDGLGDPRLQR